MPYANIPGVKVSAYLDGAFKLPSVSAQPRVLVVGPAESGETNIPFSIAAISAAETEFGAVTPLMRAAHELMAQGALNVAVMRSGGTRGSFVLEDALGSLTITPEARDGSVMERYALMIENDGVTNRYLVYDLISESFVFDSSEIEVIDNGTLTVVDTGIDLYQTTNVKESPGLAQSLAVIATADFSPNPLAVTATEGTDGLSPSLVERYAAYNSSLHSLDFKDADFILPVDCYIDDANIANDVSAATYGYYWAGVPAAASLNAASPNDKLGYLWQYIYRGQLYTYFTDTQNFFSVNRVAATKTVNTNLVLTSLVAGKGGNANTFEVTVGGTNAATVTENANGGLSIVVDVTSGTTTNSVAAGYINTALDAFTLSTGALASDLVSAAGGGTVIAALVAQNNFTSGAGGHVLTHTQLTGDPIPSAVAARFAAGADAELRECNFAHQLASFAYLASTQWSTMLGAISFKAPTAFSRMDIADWVGQMPEFIDTGLIQYITSPSDNGEGILGHKLLAGFSKTSAGYRSHLVTEGNSTDSYAFGGIIRTAGASLPNPEFPYGIDSGDEATDAGRKPVDIGKHIFVTYDWPVHVNGYNGGTSYRGCLPASLIGKLVTLPENQEPIGNNGTIQRVISPPRIHSTQLDELASIRAIGLRRDDVVGLIFVSSKTAAHPDSDYTRVSTIRCVNRCLKGIRRIAAPYIGKPFNSQMLMSLQSAIDQFLMAEKIAGFNQGAKARIEYSRADKVMGRLKVKVRMIPPFSIDTIDVETSLAAEESEL